MAQSEVILADPNKQLDSLIQLTKDNFRAGDWEAYKENHDHILVLAKTQGWQDIEVKAISNLGIYHKEKAEYDLAIKKYLLADSLSSTLVNDYKSKAILDLNLANLYQKLDQYDLSISYYERALFVVDTAKGPLSLKLTAKNGFGMAYKNKKDYHSALDHFKEVRQLAKEANLPYEEHVALCNLSHTYAELGQFDKALTYAKEALLLPKDRIPQHQYANGYIKASHALIGLERYTEALANLEETMAIAERHELPRLKILAHQHMAEVFSALESFEDALYHKERYALLKEEELSSLSKAQQIQFNKELSEKEVQLSNHLTATEHVWQQSKLKSVLIILLVLALLVMAVFALKKFRKQKTELVHTISSAEEQKVAAHDRTVVTKSDPEDKPTNGGPRLSKEQHERIGSEVVEFMKEEKPYLNPELKQSELAEKLQLSLHQLSEVLNQTFKENFNSFINRYRVEEAKRLMKDAKNKHSKVLAIAYESGFKSKTSFYRAFKALEGKTPAEYRNDIDF